MSIENGAGVEAVEPDARAVGRGGELLGAVAAVDLDGVDAAGAFVQVGVVAGVPDHPVVAALAERLVVGVAAGQGVVLAAAEQEVAAALAEQRVVAGLAEELVGAGAAGEDVVAGAAEQVRRGQRAVGLVEGDHVVAAQAEDPDERGVGDRRRATDDGDRAAVDQDPPRRVAADRDVVGGAVTGHGEHPVAERRGRGGARRLAGGAEYTGSEHDTGQQSERRASPVVGMCCGHRSSPREQPAAMRERWTLRCRCQVSDLRTPLGRRYSRLVRLRADNSRNALVRKV